ncbi:MAG: hypothetical protein COB60_03465 [Flavobacteriaceae bacterium]|nr:MAG: hypothetical protein COB60_03465 [Flavobacteriaceae bacterium]
MKIRFHLLLLLVTISISCQNNSNSPKRSIQFSGIEWDVREAIKAGPGANNWSSSKGSAFVDSMGQLHLKIRKIAGIWHCSEITSQKSFGYGKYIFFVATNVETLDPNVVTGLFTYEDDSREIDIEFTRFGDPTKEVGSYTVQPKPYDDKNKHTFSLNLNGTHATHIMEWTPEGINFESFHGHFTSLPSEDQLISRWSYKGNRNPPTGKERLHLNFWLFQGNPPAIDSDVELIISKVYVPY